MILLETEDVLALNKPPGISMATSSREGKSAQEAVARLLEACGGLPDEELRLVHRLDVGTSGVVLLARNAAAHRALSTAFQSGGARKTYRALVWGRPRPSAGVIAESLGRDLRHERKMEVRAEGKRAVTRYETLARLSGVTDLRLFPETGRTHQIRVHLSARGHPIVGDDFYGGASRWHGVRSPSHRRALAEATRPLLHAERIEIPQMQIDVRAQLPEDYLKALSALGLASLAPPTQSQ